MWSRSPVKKQSRISECDLEMFKINLTPGLPLNLKCLRIFFYCQTNLLVPGAFLFNNWTATLESGLSLSSVVSTWETSLSSKLNTLNRGLTLFCALLSDHSLQFSLKERSQKVGDQKEERNWCDGWHQNILVGRSNDIVVWGSSASEEEEQEHLWMLAKWDIVKAIK